MRMTPFLSRSARSTMTPDVAVVVAVCGIFSVVLAMCMATLTPVVEAYRPSMPLSSCYGSSLTVTSIPASFRSSRSSTMSMSRARSDTAVADENSRNSAAPFPDKVIEGLDLVPLLLSVSAHCATRRGANALMSLVGKQQERQSFDDAPSSSSERKRQLLQYRAAPSSSSSSSSLPPFASEADTPPSDDDLPIMRVAQSSSEARKEYAYVAQAMRILQSSERRRRTAAVHDDTMMLLPPVPPIYGTVSSPWDTTTRPTTDDDEWLPSSSSPHIALLTLEHLLQAEQIVKMLLDCHDWASSALGHDSEEDQQQQQQQLLQLAQIGENIQKAALVDVYEELRGSVQIQRDRSVADVHGSKGYVFKFNGEKFKDLGLLQSRERALLEQLRKPSSKSTEKMLFDRLKALQETIVEREDGLQRSLSHTLLTKVAHTIDAGLDRVARLDTIFARAAFACVTHGVVPTVGSDMKMQVPSFVYPVLAWRNDHHHTVVPTDLRMGDDNDDNNDKNDEPRHFSALMISGPNGGGKTIAMKSFGMAAVMVKLGIPVTVSSSTNNGNNAYTTPPRVDFFSEILVEVGDQQSVLDGESTLMSRLNSYSAIIELLQKPLNNDVTAFNSSSEAINSEHYDPIPATAKNTYSPKHALILLDELGGGTDPLTGAAIARAVLEKMLESGTSRVVATTHSMQLKALPVNDNRFQSAAVQLEPHLSSSASSQKYRLPTFRLAYNTIGDSYALGAASRCTPSLPEDVLTRAADLMVGVTSGATSDDGGDGGTMFQDINEALERERDRARIATQAAYDRLAEAARAREATAALARAYEEKFARLEHRLEDVFSDLQQSEARDGYDVIGDTLAEIRLVKKSLKSDEQLLAERGLRSVPSGHIFRHGEVVVIIRQNSEWEGMTATAVVKGHQDINNDDASETVTVVPGWTGSTKEEEAVTASLVLGIDEVALWDYPHDDSEWDQAAGYSSGKSAAVTGRGVRESKQRLYNILTTIDKVPSKPNPNTSSSGKKSSSEKSTFTSSRQRKAEAKQKKTKSKKKKSKR